ncbi:hypothetical protein CBA19CS22_12550 [Caballeronia novacaledonica]|uniref:Uncharacterized protein n=1 Tax=Caballeronia novacaledonica TaxID=1544861 RepID=A0ACB5QRP3_9BURK|nr:hypothetical protein CBA19CS22_12550 [Caballeronia novacaledonica]
MNPFSFDVPNILAGALNGEEESLFRVVGHFVESNPMSTWLLRVYKEHPSGARDLSSHHPGTLEAKIGGELRLVPDCIHQAVETSALSNLDNEVLQQRKQLLGWLVDEDVRQSILNKEERGKLLQKRAAEVGVSHTDLYPLLFWFLRNGMGSDALLPRRGGGAGKLRLDGDQKMGRPNAFAQDNPNSNLKGHIRTSESQSKIEDAATLMAKEGVTYNAAWLQTFPDESNAPSQSTFYKQVRSEIQRRRSISEVVGSEFFRDHVQTYMSSEVPDRLLPGDRFTADGSPGKFQLVSASNRRKRIGKPLLILVIDEASEYIVAVFATLLTESWAAYKKALLMAFTSKGEMMKALGLPEDTLCHFAKCRALSVDRGPANSLQAQHALCERLNIHHLPCPPGQPRARAIGESINNAIHRALSVFPGGSTRSRKPREVQRAKRARRNARFSLREYWIQAICFAETWNKTASVAHLYTSKMHEAEPKVEQTPEGIMRWGLQLRRAAQKHQVNRDELYRDLLDKLPTRKMRIDGIHYGPRAVYSSHAYREERDARVAAQYGTRKKDPSITPYRDSFDPDVLYFEGLNGDLIRVWRKGKEGRWEGYLPEEVDALGHLAAEARKEHIRSETRRRRVEASVRKSAKQAIGEIARNVLSPSSRDSIRANRYSESKAEANANRDEGRKHLTNFMETFNRRPTPARLVPPISPEDGQADLDDEEMEAGDAEEARLSDERFRRNFDQILSPPHARARKGKSRS